MVFKLTFLNENAFWWVIFLSVTYYIANKLSKIWNVAKMAPLSLSFEHASTIFYCLQFLGEKPQTFSIHRSVRKIPIVQLMWKWLLISSFLSSIIYNVQKSKSISWKTLVILICLSFQLLLLLLLLFGMTEKTRNTWSMQGQKKWSSVSACR